VIFTFTVTVEVERVSGRFVSRDTIAEELTSAIEDADPQQLSPDDSEYETVQWDVEEVPLPKRGKGSPSLARP
jgi:hypothetical protein